jgi:catalase
MSDYASNQLSQSACPNGQCPAGFGAFKATTMMSSNGSPVSTMTASLTSGPRGDISLTDFVLIDSLAAFDRERIPERVVHAKGGGVFGNFEITSTAFTQYCKADLFKSEGIRTPVAGKLH